MSYSIGIFSDDDVVTLQMDWYIIKKHIVLLFLLSTFFIKFDDNKNYLGAFSDCFIKWVITYFGKKSIVLMVVFAKKFMD